MLTILLFLVACGGNPARNAVKSTPDAAAPIVAPAAEVWTCPMHPEVRSDREGMCPKCGMSLVKQG